MAREHDADVHSISTTSRRGCLCPCCALRSGATALWRVAAAEWAGTALLVLLTCLTGCGPAAAASPLYRALASGLVVLLIVQSLDHVSGAQLNPTVTLAALLWGRVGPARALAMVAAQLAGGVAGGALLALLAPAGAAQCVTRPAPALGEPAALLVELLLGGCLALANCASWDERNDGLRDSWPLRIGCIVAGLSLVGGELTGASMNPVRSFAPALWAANWTSHWVYWVGPLGGSLVFTGAYALLWRAHSHRAADKP